MPYDRVPSFNLSEGLTPPEIMGTAALTTAAYRGETLEGLEAAVAGGAHPAGWLLDLSVLRRLARRTEAAAALQREALELSQVFRVGGSRAGALRLLALVAPGDLMVNTPLDFMICGLDVRLDLVFLVPGRPLPAVLPDHDVAFMAISEADAAMLARMRRLHAAWPRPMLNDPGGLPSLARHRLPRVLSGVPGLCCPGAVEVDARQLRALRDDPGVLPDVLPGASFPVLVRPVGSHAGAGLRKVESGAELAGYLDAEDGPAYLTEFVDYRSADGLYRKYRVAFVDGRPWLCHLAVSEHWMVHYLNAGMAESEGRRAMECAAMTAFETGFAVRHRAALEAIHGELGFDLFSIDCGELPDGRLVLFEADTAAIIHAMDPPDVFPYKLPQMRRVFSDFETMLRNSVKRAALPAVAEAIYA